MTQDSFLLPRRPSRIAGKRSITLLFFWVEHKRKGNVIFSGTGSISPKQQSDGAHRVIDLSCPLCPLFAPSPLSPFDADAFYAFGVFTFFNEGASPP